MKSASETEFEEKFLVLKKSFLKFQLSTKSHYGRYPGFWGKLALPIASSAVCGIGQTS